MKLCKYLLSKEAEIIAPGMGVGHTLFDPAPELLNIIEPRGIGRKGNDTNAGFPTKSGLDLGMEMYRPVVHDQIDLTSFRVEGTNLAEAACQAIRTHLMEVPDMDPGLGSIQQTHHTHQGVGTMAIAEPGLATPHAGPQPGLAGLAIEAHLVSKQDDHLFWVCTGLPEDLFQDPFFSSYWGSGE